jgi:CO dehydrogenase/acetyl-CoA synthase gamma subunit (corrinoid Fe-S protein)
MQNYPNPFNGGTIISYILPVNSFVTLTIYDVLGREIKTLVNESQQAGIHNIQFNPGTSFNGNSELSSGIYLYALKSGKFFDTKKMIFLK